MKIYFAASIRGGREDQSLYQEILVELQSFGIILTEHVASSSLIATGEQTPSADIFSRDCAWLQSADCVVAEVTTPSLGVGYEVARAETAEIPVLCLFRDGGPGSLSAMIEGNPSLVVRRYHTLDDLRPHLSAFFDTVRSRSA